MSVTVPLPPARLLAAVAATLLVPGLLGVIVTAPGLGVAGHVTAPVQLVESVYVTGPVLVPTALTVKPSDCAPLGWIVALGVWGATLTFSESRIAVTVWLCVSP